MSACFVYFESAGLAFVQGRALSCRLFVVLGGQPCLLFGLFSGGDGVWL